MKAKYKKDAKRSWFYWMYKRARKTGYGSFVPDFDQGLLTKKEFDESMMGQTIHELTKKEFVELKNIAMKGIWPKIWEKRKCNFCGKWFLGWRQQQVVPYSKNPITVAETSCSSKCRKSFKLAIGKAFRGEKLTKTEKRATRNVHYIDIH
jgi:hypothetical protein